MSVDKPGEAPAASAAKRHRVAFSIGLALIVVFVSAVLVEGILRIYAHSADTSLAEGLRQDPFGVLIEAHGETGYRPRPELTRRYEEQAATATINEMGFRGPMVSVPKPPGTFRIVLLGGSTTFGWGVDDSETIDAHMRRILAERYPGRSIDVVNLAYDGYDSYQLLERLRSDGRRFEPDALIVHSGINDVSNAWYRNIEDGDPRTLLYRATLDQLRFEQERGGATLWTRAKHYLYMARVPGRLRWHLQLSAARTVYESGTPLPLHWDALDYFERNLRRMLDIAFDEGSAVVLFSTPPSALLALDDPPPAAYWVHDAETTQMYRDSLGARMHAVVRQEAGHGRAVAYVPHGALPPALFLDGAHLSSQGNRQMAVDFVGALEQWLEAVPGQGR